MYATTPATLSDTVLDFCHSVVPDASPHYLEVKPVAGANTEDCFVVIEDHIRQHGGSVCYGWRIWEWPSVMIEAEFHAVWRDPDGHLQDVSPTAIPVNRIVFLPDPHRSYEGRQVNNVRRALRSILEVTAFFAACDAEFEFMNRGTRAEQHGRISLTPSEARELEMIQRRKLTAQLALLRRLPSQGLPRAGRNDPCPCGSGKKFKKCHGQ